MRGVQVPSMSKTKVPKWVLDLKPGDTFWYLVMYPLAYTKYIGYRPVQVTASFSREADPFCVCAECKERLTEKQSNRREMCLDGSRNLHFKVRDVEHICDAESLRYRVFPTQKAAFRHLATIYRSYIKEIEGQVKREVSLHTESLRAHRKERDFIVKAVLNPLLRKGS